MRSAKVVMRWFKSFLTILEWREIFSACAKGRLEVSWGEALPLQSVRPMDDISSISAVSICWILEGTMLLRNPGSVFVCPNRRALCRSPSVASRIDRSE